MNRPVTITQLVAILMLLFGLWIGLWTLAFTAPQFAALQREGIQKTARVARRLPYRSICTGGRNLTCKPYVLRVSFFTGGAQTADLGRLIFAELEVNEAEYNATNVDDPKGIVYLEAKPEEVWLAKTALSWKPWTNYTVSGVLLLLGGGLWVWGRNRAVSRKKPSSESG